jgi:transcriptional regulator with PAS, ATPase and Fis domain
MKWAPSAGDAGEAAARDSGKGIHAARLERGVKVDVRILAATNADLRKMVEEKKFREDLYYRLNVININLPPLRDRREDIPLLIQHFLEKFSKENEKFLDAGNRSVLRFEPEALQLLLDHTWPGNVRELENVVERAVVLASTQVIPLDVLPDYLLHAGGIRLRRSENGALPPDASLFEIVADFERRTICRATGAVQLEPDRSGGGPARAAVHAESEDQAPEYRREAARRYPVQTSPITPAPPQ